MAQTKTDNSLLIDKVLLRAENLPDGDELHVLDAFGGKGLVWDAVQRSSGRSIKRTAIDKRTDLDIFYIHADNKKALGSINLQQFDIIDLDAYGIPCDQIAEVIDSKFKGMLFVTMIQSHMGAMPMRMLSDLGITDEMRLACPTLYSRIGWGLFKDWLAVAGVTTIKHRSHARKHYLCINCAGLRAADYDSHLAGSVAGLS